jgi:hypothetical protein
MTKLEFKRVYQEFHLQCIAVMKSHGGDWGQLLIDPE